MSALAEFQSEFAAAVVNPETQWTQRLGAGFAVYQNTVTKGLIDVLRANYPTVERLVGAQWFNSVARLYAQDHLPAEPALAMYGAAFAQFLTGFSTLAELPYVTFVAQLDRLWTEAHFAADAAPLPATALHASTPEQLQSLRLSLHPATRFAWLPHSAVTIWLNHRPPMPMAAALTISDAAEGVLLTRPVGDIRSSRLNPDELLFVQQIGAGESLADAAVSVLDRHADADIAAILAKFMTAGAFMT